MVEGHEPLRLPLLQAVQVSSDVVPSRSTTTEGHVCRSVLASAADVWAALCQKPLKSRTVQRLSAVGHVDLVRCHVQ